MAGFRYTWRTFTRELALIATAVVFMVPLYLVAVISLKPAAKAFTKPLALPLHPQFGAYPAAWKEGGRAGLGNALLNSTIITFSSVVMLILFGSLTAYTLARRGGRLSSGLYILFLLGIIIPFQLGIVPLYVAMRHLNLTGSLFGMVILYTGLLMPLSVFLYTGFIRTLPREYEEAAEVDGAGMVRTFARITFPLLAPVTGTVAILTGLTIWNDFFVPIIFLSGSKSETLTVALYSFVSENESAWNKVFAGVAVAITPMLVFYLFAQRHLIKGFSGGMKG
jgi:raffinose/stachyose/melibiose transport system permease protein